MSLVDGAPAGTSLPDDTVIVSRLRERDEVMFTALVDAWSPAMLRVAGAFVTDARAAQDVVQEAWLEVVHGIGGFRAHCPVHIWVLRILIDRARICGTRDARTVPVEPVEPTPEDLGPTVDPARLRGWYILLRGHWTRRPAAWPPLDDDATGAVRQVLSAALASLPERQRVVVILRDVQGYRGDEVCQLLELTPANQRVLLHRGRAALRAAVETHRTKGAVT
jgi:RNA polymerase sigma-70 factor, ECF subfamily